MEGNNMMKEKPVHLFKGIDFEGNYIIRSDGNITSNKKGEVLVMNPYLDTYGYMVTNLSKNGIQVGVKIHRLVALNFCENDDPINKIHVDHIDGDKLNNHYTNLEWVTPHENNLRARKTGLRPMVITGEIGHKVCDMIWNKGMTDIEIAKELGLTVGNIHGISSGNRHRYISNRYSNGNWSPNTNQLTEEQIKEVCELRWLKHKSPKEIIKKTGINKSTTEGIMYGRINRHISEPYIKKAYDILANTAKKYIRDIELIYTNLDMSERDKIQYICKCFPEIDNQVIKFAIKKIKGEVKND